MNLEVAIGDRVRTVGIIRKDGLLLVELDGRVHRVDACRVNEAVVSLLIQRDGTSTPAQSIDAAFATQPTTGDYDVHVDGKTVAVRIRPAGAFGRQRKDGAGAAGSGPQRVTSPMPGKVVGILVKAGDEVKARQGLVVVEAMKMENELRAARDGRVREIAVAEGQSVDAGMLLLIVE